MSGIEWCLQRPPSLLRTSSQHLSYFIILLIFPPRNELLLHLKTYNIYYEGQNLQLRHREVRNPPGAGTQLSSGRRRGKKKQTPKRREWGWVQIGEVQKK